MTSALDIEDSAALRRWLVDTGRVAQGRAFTIRNLAGGVLAWVRDVDPSQPTY